MGSRNLCQTRSIGLRSRISLTSPYTQSAPLGTSIQFGKHEDWCYQNESINNCACASRILSIYHCAVHVPMYGAHQKLYKPENGQPLAQPSLQPNMFLLHLVFSKMRSIHDQSFWTSHLPLFVSYFDLFVQFYLMQVVLYEVMGTISLQYSQAPNTLSFPQNISLC